ncbi:MAG: hypothetical protein IPL01_06945 [Acidobacteria bacterium]|nr:hypothetical protein [Acidobacteriota bacterium]MBK9706489.1 hypothetical protein [Acidobacteriota bacterium]
MRIVINTGLNEILRRTLPIVIIRIRRGQKRPLGFIAVHHAPDLGEDDTISFQDEDPFSNLPEKIEGAQSRRVVVFCLDAPFRLLDWNAFSIEIRV